MRKPWDPGKTIEKRPRLGIERLDERLGSRGKKYSREDGLFASEFNWAMKGDDVALKRAVRRYTDHQIEYLSSCDTPAKTVLEENFEPRSVDDA